MVTTRKSTAAKARERLQVANEQAEIEVEAAGEAPPQRRSGAAYSEVPLAAVALNLANVREGLGDLTDLSASIEAVGVLQPLVVRPLAEGERNLYPEGTRYVAVMGNRRRAASEIAGQQLVPVVVRTDLTGENQRRQMLVENLQRADLTPLEEARAFQAELDAGLSQHALAREVGVTQAHVSRRVALLRLDPALQALVGDGRVGVDLAVNDLGKLPAEDQHAVAEQLTEHAAGDLDPGEVREAVASVRRTADMARRQTAQRQRAEEAGAVVLEGAEARERFGDRLWDRQLHRADQVAEAAEAGELVAVLTGYGEEPQFLSTAARPAAPKSEDDPETRQRREWKARRQAVDAWVAQHPKPAARTEFVAALERYAVETMPHETGTIVHKWLQGRVGMKGDYQTWEESLTEADYATVAWHLTVASDLLESRWASSTPAGQRTAARVEEVTGRG